MKEVVSKNTARLLLTITALAVAVMAVSFAVGIFASDDACADSNAAKIGDTEYATLVDAVNNVKSGDTITLLIDSSGAGIFLAEGEKDFCIDFDGHTYECIGPAVGSTGTVSQAFHLEKGNTVKLMNGVITSTDTSGVLMLVQNYCNLTVDAMTLDGTNLPGSGRYVLSNNCGTVSVIDSYIKAKDGDFAMDSCKFMTYAAPTVTVSGKSTLDGKIEVTGGTATLKDGVTVNGQVRVGENRNGGITGGIFNLETGATIQYVNNYAVVVFGNNVANINGTVNGLIGTNGYLYNAGSTINIGEGAVINAGDNIAVYLPSGTLNVTGGEIRGSTAVYFKAKILNITGGTFNATGEKVAVKENWDGGDATGDAIVIHNMNYPDADKATVSINGATISSTNASQVAYYVGTASTDMSITSNVDIDGMVAKIGNAYYATLEDAFKAVDDKETITVIRDLTVSSNIVVPDKSFILDFNNKKVTADGLGIYNIIQIGGYGSGPAFANDLTIKNAEFCGTGSGNTSVNCIQAEISGKLTIENCKFNDFDGLNREMRIVTSDSQAGISITGCSFDKSMGAENDVIKFSGIPCSSYSFDNNTVFNTTSGEVLCVKFYTIDSFGFTVAEPVATIGKYYYDSIEMAIGCVQSNETITVLKDITVKSSIQINQPKDFTLDFNNKKVTADGLGVYNIIQIGGYGSGPVFANELTIKNAEFCGTGEGNTSVNCIQAEISKKLTIDNCKFNDFDGLNREIRVVASESAIVGVINCSFDSSMGAEEDILKISGTFGTPVFRNNTILDAKTGEEFCIYTSAGIFGMKIAVPGAKIVRDEVTYYYCELPDAFNMAVDKDSIVVLKAFETASAITVSKDVTLVLNGFKLSSTTGSHILNVIDASIFTIDGTVESSEIYGRINVGQATNDNGNITIKGGVYSCCDDQTVLHVNGTCLDSDVTIIGAMITSPNDNGIQLNGYGVFTLKDCTITGATAVYVKSGELTIENCSFVGNKDPVDYSYNGNGANATGDGLIIDACNYPGGDPTVTIKSGTITGTKSSIGVYNSNGGKATLNLNGGTFDIVSIDEGTVFTIEGNVTINVLKITSSETKKTQFTIGKDGDLTVTKEITVDSTVAFVYNGKLDISIPIVITSNSASKVYDAKVLTDDGYTCEYKFGFGVATITVTGSQMDAGISKNVVSYEIVFGTVDIKDCYTDVTVTEGTLEVTKAPLVISYISETVKCGGKPAYAMDYKGFVGGETKAVLINDATITPQTPVTEGAYKITPVGASAKNYAISYTEGVLTVVHDMKAVEKSGNIAAHFKCDGCGNLYLDEKGTMSYTLPEPGSEEQKVSVKAIVTEGKATVDSTKVKDIADSITKIKEADPSAVVVAEISVNDSTVNTASVKSEDVKKLAEKASEVKISAPAIAASFTSETLKEVATAGSFDFSASKAASVPEKYKDLVGVNGIVLNVNLNVDGKAVTQFKEKVKLSFYYEIPTGHSVKELKVYCISGDSPEEFSCTYDEETHMVTAETSHFSQYAVTLDSSSSSDTGVNVLYIIVAVIIAIIVILIILTLVHSKKDI